MRIRSSGGHGHLLGLALLQAPVGPGAQQQRHGDHVARDHRRHGAKAPRAASAADDAEDGRHEGHRPTALGLHAIEIVSARESGSRANGA